MMRQRVITRTMALIGLATVVTAQSSSAIPAYFFDNYAIKTQRGEILSMFTTIEASKNTASDLDKKFFTDLHGYFEDVFPYLPQDGEFGTIYEQCRITARNLSSDYTYNKFEIFLNSCYTPLNKAINKMNSQYSIKPSVKVNPSSGAAPLSVTFDARGSIDPSNDTIPSSNFFWYYKDTNGQDQVIGQGPVVNHIFSSEGNYQVHLTVRSVNQPTKGILDGAETVSVSVTPQSARIRVFANGKQLDERNHTKIGTAEAQRGVLLDASATVPTGGRTIEEHSWLVQQGSKTIYSRSDAGRPGIASVQFPAEGQFNISLSVVDNQGNRINKTYQIVVSDPLAIIKSSPEQGDTSTTFGFDGGTSYSLISNISLYTREIFDSNDQKIDTFQGKSISKKFVRPGSYTIKLTVEDEQGRTNSDVMQLYVESTQPQAQFRMISTQDRLHPSQFRFDAGLSSDIDIINADDTLKYQWRFTPEQYVTFENIEDNAREIIASFDAPGEYQAKLTVQDSYGKMHEVIKKITIESAIRPTIFMAPKATQRNIPITMVARSNMPVISYEWDFGDGTTESSTSSPKVTHTYDKVGSYLVTLKVYGPDNQENTVTDHVFIGEKDSPIPQFIIQNQRGLTMKQKVDCPEGPAYQVNRRESITIDASNSVNTKGSKSNIEVYIQPQGADIFQRSSIKYQFQELGCQAVDITVRDKQNTRNSNTRVWFQVVNTLPEIQNLTLSFPQYGGASSYGIDGIGIGKTNNSTVPDPADVFSPNIFDPLVVRVDAQGARDIDGVISYYKRYYYKKDNPSRYLETKITPASVPEVYFSLPRQGGEYEFGVTIVDNDGGESRSTDQLGGGRTVFFPPDTSNTNIPIVTLTQSHTVVKAGDEVTFDVSANIISDRPDFATHRVIKYDFDGDGIYDLTTKDDKVTHTFRQPGTFTPKAVVIYRDNKGIDFGEDITVEQNIKPLMYISQHGPYILARDISIGSIIESHVCVDARSCPNDPSLVYDLGQESDINKKSFVYRYPKLGRFFLDIQVKDDLGQEASRKYPIMIEEEDAPFFYPLTIPEAKQEGDNFSITVGSQLNNTISYLLQYAGDGYCYMDKDITVDSNGDKVLDNDDDIICNELTSILYEGASSSMAGKIFYEHDNKEVARDITINFVDIKNTLSPDQQLVYTKLGIIISTLPNSTSEDNFLKSLLIRLQGSLDERDVRGGLIMDIESAMSDPGVTIADSQRNQILSILASMKDDSLIAAGGGTVYEQAKAEILILVGESQRELVDLHFKNIETGVASTPDQIKDELNTIIKKLLATVDQQGGIDQTDVNSVLMPNMCRIMEYYSIVSKTCQSYSDTGASDTPGPALPEEASSGSSSGWVSGVLKRILIIVGILILVFGGLVGFFVIKARRAQAGKAE